MSKKKTSEGNRIEDIAKIVGVSAGTVSNALNNRRGVSEKKKMEILRVASSLGYNRNIQKKADETLRFIIFKRHGAVVDDTPFFSQLIKGIEIESRKNGYELLITHVNARDIREDGSIQVLEGDCSNGMILLATEMLASDLAAFERNDIPLVVLDNSFRGMEHDCVLINNEDGVYRAVKHLVDMGHRKIGLLHASDHINNFYYRRTGFYEIMKNFDLPVNPRHEILLSPRMEETYHDMISFLDGNTRDLPTAFFAENDIIGIGAMRAMQKVGIVVPEDISIVGFDDLPYTEVCTPSMTTLRVEKREMGELAVRTLVSRINGRMKAFSKLQLCTKLIIRDSVHGIADPPPLKASPMIGVF